MRPGPRSLAVLLAAYRLGLWSRCWTPTAGPDVLLARSPWPRRRWCWPTRPPRPWPAGPRPLARRARLALPDLTALAPVHIGRRLPGCAPGLTPRRGPVPAAYDGNGDAVIVFTSGTTSRPRAVVHTRAGLSAACARSYDLVARPVPGARCWAGRSSCCCRRLPPAHRWSCRRAPAAGWRGSCAPRAAGDVPDAAAVAGRPGRRRGFTGRVYSGSAPVSAALLAGVRGAGAAEAWGVYALTEVFPAAAVEAAEKATFDGPGIWSARCCPASARASTRAGSCCCPGRRRRPIPRIRALALVPPATWAASTATPSCWAAAART